MTSPDVTFTEATAEMATAYYGCQPPYSFKGYVALHEGRPIGVGGVFFSGDRPVAFSDMKDEMRPMLKAKARAVRVLETLIRSFKVPVYAVAAESTSVGLLTKLGFTDTHQKASAGPVMMREPT